MSGETLQCLANSSEFTQIQCNILYDYVATPLFQGKKGEEIQAHIQVNRATIQLTDLFLLWYLSTFVPTVIYFPH